MTYDVLHSVVHKKKVEKCRRCDGDDDDGGDDDDDDDDDDDHDDGDVINGGLWFGNKVIQ